MVLTNFQKEEKDEEMKRKNAFFSLVTRQNAGLYSKPINVERAFMDSMRYTDPLIRDKVHDITNPAHRERVAMEDPIGYILTWGFAMGAWDKYPKFYDSEQLDAPEVLPEVREFLKSIDFHELCVVVGALTMIHGWCIVRPWADETGRLRYEVYSDNQIRDTDWIRDSAGNVIAWRVQKTQRELPLRRSSYGILNKTFAETTYEIIPRESVIYVVRGDREYSSGFGISRLEQVWDSLTKLREKSHADHFRARVFPISIVPPNWDDSKISEYFRALSLMDMSHALVVRSAVDSQNNPVPALPTINWMSPAQNAPTRAQGPSGGGLSDLDSDWARICTATKHTVAFFVGGGVISSSLAAAGVDDDRDLRTEITEFNTIFKTFIVDFIDFLNQKYGLDLPAPAGLAIKSHWEWTRDESRYQQMVQQQSLAQQAEDKRKNVAPGQFVPVNSTSGNVRLVGVKPAGPNENVDRILVKYKSPYGWYEYTDPEMDVDAVTDDIAARGGDAVWDHLRGRSGELGYPVKSAPGARRFDAQGNRLKYPNVGRAHEVNYTGSSGPSSMFDTMPAVGSVGATPARAAVAGGVLQPRQPRPAAEIYQEAKEEAEQEHKQRLLDIPPIAEQMATTLPAPEQLVATEEDMRPRRGRPRKTTDIKGGSTRLYVKGRRGRQSFREFAEQLESAAQSQIQQRKEDLFEEKIRQEYAPPQEDEEEEEETLTEEDLADLEEGEYDPYRNLERVRRALRLFTRGARRMARLGRRLTRNELEELDPEAYVHPWFRHYNSISAVARELKIGKKSVYEALEGVETASINSATLLGNSFSTKNPFVYVMHGFPTIEYQCPEAIKALIGTSTPIIYTHESADPDTLEPLSDDLIIGRYTIIGYDEQEGHEIAKYELFEDKITKNNLQWLKEQIEQGQLPETSTAYFNRLRYDRDRQRFIQTDFRLKHVAIVQKGNCRTPYCSVQKVADKTQ